MRIKTRPNGIMMLRKTFPLLLNAVEALSGIIIKRIP
jgi:hypothetical protein